MNKVIRNSMILVACLMLGLMVKATTIGGPGAGASVGNGNMSVLGCGGGGTQLKREDCGYTTPVYACTVNGTLEDCAEAQECP